MLIYINSAHLLQILILKIHGQKYKHEVWFLCPSFPQLGSRSSAGTVPTARPKRATWRPMSCVSTVSPSTTACTPTAASAARTHPRRPPECLRVSREIIARRAGSRLAWHHSVGLDVVMATANTDGHHCLTLKGVKRDWDCKKQKRIKTLTANFDVHSSVYLKSHSMYLSVAEAAYIKVRRDVKVQLAYLASFFLFFFSTLPKVSKRFTCVYTHPSEQHLSDKENAPCRPKACVLSSSKYSVLHFCKNRSISLPVQKSCLSVRMWCQMFGL